METNPTCPAVFAVGLALGLAVLAIDGPVPGQGADATPRWLGTWFAASTGRVDQAAATLSAAAARGAQPLVIPPAVQAVAPGQQLPVGGQSPLHFNNQTLRQIVHITLGGARFRVVLSNTFGIAPLTIGAARLAIRDRDAANVPRSSRVLTFGGRERGIVAAGATLLSDPSISLRLISRISPSTWYLPGDTAAMQSPITTHPAAWQMNYVSPPGNHAGAGTMPVQTTTAYRRTDELPTATWFFLARVEVMAARPAGAIVALGDSITDGTGRRRRPLDR